jgi:hypothetical protein
VRRLRVISWMVCALVAVAISMPAQAIDDEPGLPFESTHTEGFCGNAARTADSNSCNVVGNASFATGDVSAKTHLVSPAGGTLPWSALASSDGGVVANYHLTQPVRELDFVIEVRVNRADVTLGSGLPGWVGYNLEPILGRQGQAGAGAAAFHSACSDCGGGTSIIVLPNMRPGTTATTSGQDVSFGLRVLRAEGKLMPPGDVTIRAGVNASVFQSSSWGNDSVSIDAVVTRIALS